MQINGKTHLCYSMNVFPEKDWLAADSEIRKKVLALRREVTGSDSAKFAIGMWVDAKTACEFLKKANLRKFKKWLDDNNLYVFTFNAFPYANFHGRPVKKKVYLPDWTTKERLKYTCMIADILSELLPEGVTGSISTLPGGYMANVKSEKQVAKLAGNLMSAAKYLKMIKEKTGKKIILGIEPEPDCLWENPSEFIDFHHKYFLSRSREKKYIGVCYDTCHQEVLMNQPGNGLQELLAHKIPIAKFQLSAALEAPTRGSKKALAKFADEVYLHQTRVLEKDWTVTKYPDLPAAMKSADRNRPWVVHYHVPVFTSGLTDGLVAAKRELGQILKTAGDISNFEIETYTFSVLPAKMRKLGVISSMKKEYKWVIKKMSGK
ncbi:MAG: metabolite traffic protein EboE [Victivallales bacterium]